MGLKERIYEHLVGILTWLIVYFYPTYPLILTIGFFIMADTILGVLAAKKTNTLGHKVSKKFRPAIDKFIGYGISILVAHVMEIQFMPDFPAMKIIGGYLIFIELKSIDENFKILTGISAFQIILDKMKNPKKQ